MATQVLKVFHNDKIRSLVRASDACSTN